MTQRVNRVITGRNEVVAKVMFLHVCVILFTGGSLQAGRTPPPDQADHPPPSRKENPPGPGRPPPRQEGGTPPDQADHPPAGARTRQTTPPAGGRTPPDQADHPPGRREEPPPGPADTPLDQADPPGRENPSPREADSRIRSTSGRYASYWNAFLLMVRSHCPTQRPETDTDTDKLTQNPM